MKDGIDDGQIRDGYPGALQLDVQDYLPGMDDFDMSEERKVEFLHTLWEIMSALVDLGWGVDSIHNFIPALREISSNETSTDEKMESHTGADFAKASRAEDGGSQVR
jgi:hypothetical protein